MKTKALILGTWVVAVFGISTAAPGQTGAAADLDYVTIDQPNNPADVNGCGRVGYSYKISRDKVDNRTYVEFLNDVDPSGTNSKALYNPKMMLSPQGGIIFNSNKPDGSRYQVKTGMADSPVTFVGWADAARFMNWLNNGGRKGSSTEVGAYNLRASKGKMVARNGATKFCLPNQDELYKAAFFLPTGVSRGDSDDLYASPASGNANSADSGAIAIPIVNNKVFELVDPYDVEDSRPQWTAENRGTPSRFQFAGKENPANEDESVGFRLLVLTESQKYAENDDGEEEVEEFAGAPGLTNTGFTPSFPAPSSGGQGFGGVFSPISNDLPPSS